MTTAVWPAGVLAVALTMAGCGTSGSSGGTPSTPSVSSSATAADTQSTSMEPTELGTIKESGFGQSNRYVWATAVVRNNSTFVGQTVTVNFNVLDAGGAILASQAQVESFSRPESDHVIGTQIDLDPGAKAAKVETSLSVEASGAFSDQPFPAVKTSNYRIGTDEYGAPRVTFEITNPLQEPLKAPRIGIICRNTAGKIIGGGSEYPDLVPAGGRIRVSSSVTVTGKPVKCTADVSAPSDWDGPKADNATSAATEQAPAGTAAAAFKKWVNQFTASDWDSQYDTLVSAQQKLISKARYKACRAADAADIKWVKVLSVQDAGPTLIPGTKLKLPSTKVTAQVTYNGIKAPVDAHMFNENGQWRWTMTQENLNGCT